MPSRCEELLAAVALLQLQPWLAVCTACVFSALLLCGACQNSAAGSTLDVVGISKRWQSPLDTGLSDQTGLAASVAHACSIPVAQPRCDSKAGIRVNKFF
jgi:hypothetical protein